LEQDKDDEFLEARLRELDGQALDEINLSDLDIDLGSDDDDMIF
jgi:hypothetical protein